MAYEPSQAWCGCACKGWWYTPTARNIDLRIADPLLFPIWCFALHLWHTLCSNTTRAISLTSSIDRLELEGLAFAVFHSQSLFAVTLSASWLWLRLSRVSCPRAFLSSQPARLYSRLLLYLFHDIPRSRQYDECYSSACLTSLLHRSSTQQYSSRLEHSWSYSNHMQEWSPMLLSQLIIPAWIFAVLYPASPVSIHSAIDLMLNNVYLKAVSELVGRR